MKIETKFDIGENVWVVDVNAPNSVVEIASGIITEINIGEDNRIIYYFGAWCYEYAEDQLIKYDDTKTLLEKIKLIDNQIKEKNKQ